MSRLSEVRISRRNIGIACPRCVCLQCNRLPRSRGWFSTIHTHYRNSSLGVVELNHCTNLRSQQVMCVFFIPCTLSCSQHVSALIKGYLQVILYNTKYFKERTPWSESASDRRLSVKLVPTFVDRGCHVVSVTDPYGRILGFEDRSRYFFFQVAPQLYSRGWVDSVPDPLLRKSGSAGNRTRASGSVARNS
jgi:hypothetical protein